MATSDEYIRGAHRRVEGALSPLAMRMIATVAAAQDEVGVVGSVGEIGVHHGKLFLLLHLLNETTAPPGGAVDPGGPRSVAVDLFGRQDENVDGSGEGDRAVLMSHVARLTSAPERVVAVTANSTELTADDLARELGTPARLFSVDGGHTADLTAHDVVIAAPNLREGGVLVLDDVFNDQWPGVSEGIARVLLARPDLVVPFAIGGNKTLLTTDAAAAARYREHLARAVDAGSKPSEYFGHEVVVFNNRRLEGPRTLVRRSAVWASLRDRPVGRAVRRVTTRVLG